jgi:quinol monooxygenase YgiN
MSEAIICVDSSQIRDGKLEHVLSAVERLVAFVEANEAETIAYSIYVDEERGRMTVVQIHPSSASMEFHMDVAAPVFREFAGLLTLERVDFYGRPSDALLDQMRGKAELLGGAPVVVNERRAGFIRLAVGSGT